VHPGRWTPHREKEPPVPESEIEYYITGFCSGSNAEKLGKLGEETSKAKFLAQLDEIFEDYIGEEDKMPSELCTGCIMFEWAKEPFIRGGYSALCLTESPDARVELAKPVRDIFFFAGEATNSTTSYMTCHGAIESGSRAAQEVIEVLKKRSESLS
jgi:monoamine oxidase